MAKYRITSIPQFRDGKKKKKQQSVMQSGWNSPVEGFEPNSSLAAFIPNQSMVEQPTQYIIDPNQQDIPLSQRTGLEQLATQPEFGNVGYGYKRNLLTNQLDLVPTGTPTYEKDLFGRTITEVQANPDAPINYAGEKLNCGPGKRPYKGVCLTDDEYAQVKAEEETNINYRIQEEEKVIENAKKTLANNFNEYIKNASTKGNKYKKGVLNPFITYKKDQWEKNNLDAWYNNPENGGSLLYYKEKKDLGNGNYEIRLYPRKAIENMMNMYGVKPEEFEKYHGLNAKELQKEYEPYLNYLHDYYINQGQDIIRKYIEQGLSAEEAKKKLITDKEYGKPSEIEKNFKDAASTYDFKYNADKYFVDDQGVMYTRDRSGNVYRYTNNPQNKDFKVFDYNSTDPNSSPFSKNNYHNQGVFTWEPVDKSEFKLNNDGSLNVNGRQANLFDYTFKGRDKKKNENTILTNYKNYINKGATEFAKLNSFYNIQNAYQTYNNKMFDHVHGNAWTTDLPEISLNDILQGNLQHQYVSEYNKAVKKINAITKNNTFSFTNKTKDVSSNPDYYRKQKAKIVEEFINKVKNTGPKIGNKKVDFGSLTGYQKPFTGRNIQAYKDGNTFTQQRNFTTNEEANNWLRYAFENNINPDEATILDNQYRGETEGWNDKYENYDAFAASPEGQKYLEIYKSQPSFARSLLTESATIKNTNLAKDQYAKQVELARQRMENMQDNMPWYGQVLDQGMALLTHPVDTVSDWTSGKLQDPFIGAIGDNPTQQDYENLEREFGKGAAQVYSNSINEMYENPVEQGVKLFNPLYYLSEAGKGLGRKISGDQEASTSDILQNTLFGFLPVSKTAKTLYGTKLLSPMAKYVPSALKAGKYLPRVGNTLTHAVTPGNALNAYFMNHAFIPHTDPITGETEQGFAVDAANQTWEGLTDKDGIDWSKITPNLLNLYMGYNIGAHGLGTANQFAGNLVGKPSLLNTTKLTQPVIDPLEKIKYNLTNPLQLYRNPRTGNINFIRSKSEIRPTLDRNTNDLINNIPPDSFSPIRFGDDYAAKDHEWVYVDPENYNNSEDWKELGKKDANETLNYSLSRLPKYGSETFKGVGDFEFEPWSDGWQVRNDMMNAFDKPQWAASNKDFFSRDEFNDLLMKQLEYDMARMKFDEMHPEDPSNMLLGALRGEPNRKDELFANLFPGIGLPNWRSKFTTPEQESFLRERVMDYNPTVRQMGKLNPASLKTLNVGLDTLPKTYKDLVNPSEVDRWLKTAPAKDVVSEMREGLGVKLSDIQNATPEQLEAWRQQIVKKMYNQTLQRWNNDINTPFKGSDAWKEISSQPGYKNKNGGISMKLSKTEIDKYVKEGYIVEEE